MHTNFHKYERYNLLKTTSLLPLGLNRMTLNCRTSRWAQNRAESFEKVRVLSVALEI